MLREKGTHTKSQIELSQQGYHLGYSPKFMGNAERRNVLSRILNSGDNARKFELPRIGCRERHAMIRTMRMCNVHTIVLYSDINANETQ